METTINPFIDEWVRKLWGIHSMKYNSAVKEDNVSFGTKMMELEKIMFSELRR